MDKKYMAITQENPCRNRSYHHFRNITEWNPFHSYQWKVSFECGTKISMLVQGPPIGRLKRDNDSE